MTRTADDDHGYGGSAPAYDGSGDRWRCDCGAIVWPDAPLRTADMHTRDRVAASERADAEQAAIMRDIRRERDMRRGGRPE